MYAKTVAHYLNHRNARVCAWCANCRKNVIFFVLLGRFVLGSFVAAAALRIHTIQRTFTDCGDAIKANKKKVKKTQPTSPATQFNCVANICNTPKSRQCNFNARFKTHTKRARDLCKSQTVAD